ncbi:hypothetical protein [Methylobacterium sp. A54F]
MHRHTLLWATILCLGTATLRAQEAPDIPTSKRNAAKLAGLVGFVNLHCEKLRTDQDRFKGAVQAMGVDPAELDRDVLLLQARSYLAAYQQDVPGSCTRAQDLFGQSGTIIPGVFSPR